MTSAETTYPLSTEIAAPNTPRIVFITLIAGVLSGSSAGILTRYALGAGAPPLLIAALRLTLAALFITPFALRHLGEIRQLSRRDFIMLSISGAWMSLNFVLWTLSLENVGVLIATVLVTSSPIWTALLEITFLKVRFTQMIFVGLIAAITGNILIAVAGNSSAVMGKNPLLGATFAISAAIAIAMQRTIARGVRMRLSLIPFLWMLYGIGAIILLGALVVTQTPIIGHAPNAYFWILMLTIFPQLIGHSSFNFALRYVPATFISLMIQGEPVIAAFAALVLFNEIPTLLQMVGSVIIVLGVIAATLGRNIKISALVSMFKKQWA